MSRAEPMASWRRADPLGAWRLQGAARRRYVKKMRRMGDDTENLPVESYAGNNAKGRATPPRADAIRGSLAWRRILEDSRARRG